MITDSLPSGHATRSSGRAQHDTGTRRHDLYEQHDPDDRQ
jgi:hypothetical protein